ncbi:hypothetical protein [Sphingobium sp.]|uniref:hypothetical protein n=2 Tax=Sphingobium sp. TaxID=1912891 RepID=UPI002E1D1E9D
MMRSFSAALSLILLGSFPAHARDPVTIDYVLPGVTVTAGVAQRITKCPTSAEAQAGLATGAEGLRVEFAYKVAIAGKQAPRRLVRLDAETGFLVDRETKVQFNEDWYLKTFNGRTTGQGGPLLVSLIKAGAAVLAMSANPILGVGPAAAAIRPNAAVAEGLDRPVARPRYFATRWYLECQPKVIEQLKELEERREDVAALEARVIGGDASTTTQDLLTLRRSEVSTLEAALTINATLKGGLAPALAADASIANLAGQIPAPDISRWFRVTAVRKEVREARYAITEHEPSIAALLQKQDPRIPGLYGYQVRIAPDAKLASWFGCDPKAAAASACAAEVAKTDPLPTRDLVFVRPIPASVKLWPNPAPCAAATVCEADETWVAAADASGSGSVKLPQLSRLYTMRTGGSIFGGRTVGAEFGASGEPMILQYNIGSGGKDVASVIDAGVSGAQTIRDAEGAATKRKLDELKNARDLQDLLDELDEEVS